MKSSLPLSMSDMYRSGAITLLLSYWHMLHIIEILQFDVFLNICKRARITREVQFNKSEPSGCLAGSTNSY